MQSADVSLRAQAAADLVRDLSSALQKRYLRKLAGDKLPSLRVKQRLFAVHYAEHGNPKLAARQAGYKAPPCMERNRELQEAAEQRMQALEKESELRAEYVRGYIHDVLEFSPLDFFDVAPDGGWCITPERMQALPAHVKKLVESVEMRFHGGRATLTVKFISKTAALSMAARYTLTQKHVVAAAQLPWDEINRALARESEDAVAKKLADYDAMVQVPRSEGDEGGALAVSDALRPAVGDRRVG